MSNKLPTLPMPAKLPTFVNRTDGNQYFKLLHDKIVEMDARITALENK